MPGKSATSAGLQGDPPGAVIGPAGAQGGGGGGVFGEPDKVVVYGHAEAGKDGEVPVHGMGVIGAAGDGDIVETARAFADFVEADEGFAIGEPGKGAAAGEALEVDDEVEVLFAEPADAAEHFGPVAGFGPAFALEGDDPGEVGVVLQQRREGGINPPVNLRQGVALFEEPQDG